MDSEYLTQLPDKDLLETLEKGAMMERFKHSDEWKVINEVCHRLAAQAQEELLKIPADETVRIIELQQTVKLYRNVLNSILNSFADMGRLAFQEAKERELLKNNGPSTE